MQNHLSDLMVPQLVEPAVNRIIGRIERSALKYVRLAVEVVRLRMELTDFKPDSTRDRFSELQEAAPELRRARIQLEDEVAKEIALASTVYALNEVEEEILRESLQHELVSTLRLRIVTALDEPAEQRPALPLEAVEQAGRESPQPERRPPRISN